MTAVTTHVLDTARGEPAAGVVVRLERVGPAGDGVEIGRAVTDADGRIADFGLAMTPLPAGTYRLVFETAAYLAAGSAGGPPFFPEVAVAFAADGSRSHYHVPLLLSPYSYSTYRGS
ncbi:MAG TPA: hydroxyisourate hydrolase [Streptosporangiaceae bacterium]|nr:hydroxyisourate hydrolase [Streptosporangiaceae bacterium]